MPLSTGMLRSPPARCRPGVIESASNSAIAAAAEKSKRCAMSGTGRDAPSARPRRSKVSPSRSSSTQASSCASAPLPAAGTGSACATSNPAAASAAGSWLSETACWRDTKASIAARVGLLPDANSKCSPAASACCGGRIVEPPLRIAPDRATFGTQTFGVIDLCRRFPNRPPCPDPDHTLEDPLA